MPDDAMDDLLDLLSYTCPFTGRHRTAGSGYEDESKEVHSNKHPYEQHEIGEVDLKHKFLSGMYLYCYFLIFASTFCRGVL